MIMHCTITTVTQGCDTEELIWYGIGFGLVSLEGWALGRLIRVCIIGRCCGTAGGLVNLGMIYESPCIGCCWQG